MINRRKFIRNTMLAPVFLFAAGKYGSMAEFKKKSTIPFEKPRVIIETDAGGDPDDEQSLVRFLLYSNDFDIEGIIANRPLAREGENLNKVRDGLGIVRAHVNAYGESYLFLKQNHPDYPEPAYLLERTVPGYDDTDDGVNLIIRSVDSHDKRPVWFMNWGTDKGSAESCLKRALDKVLKERGQKGYEKFKNRLMLSSFDKFGDHTISINPPFPLWIDTFMPILGNRRWYHRFSALTSKAGGFDIERDIRTNHGPLGLLYPTNTNFQQKEGDTMSFLYLLPSGMSYPYEPGWGSWGGRYGHNEEHPGKPYFWANQADTWNGTTNRDNTLARWAVALQNDFRARMDWCVRPPAETNHHPVAILNADTSKDMILINAKPGEEIKLSASGSHDPDKRRLSIQWIPYPEAGTCTTEIPIKTYGQENASFIAPQIEKSGSIHIILEVKNDGDPALYSYRRVIINVTP
jgi:hypothetical protein